tara:strand:+ start:4125 stop:5318 length:1194 start_codon:yes stop_codon:yes gene_type:complete
MWSYKTMRPRLPVGDEGDYIGGEERPLAGLLFIRVPGMAALAHLLGDPAQREARLRVFMASAGTLCAILVVTAALLIAGWGAAFIAAVLLLVLPERLVLNNHIWPDPLLAFSLAAINLLLVVRIDPTVTAAGLGVLVLLSTITRIDQLVLAIVVPVVFVMREAGTVMQLMLIVAPTIVALLACTCWNYYKRGVALPDNTWVFNLRIAEADTRTGQPGTRVQPLIHSVRAHWQPDVPLRAQQVRGTGRSIWRRRKAYVNGVVNRMWSLLGPDSFISERLLLPQGSSYLGLDGRELAFWRFILRYTFPALVAMFLFGILAGAQGVPLLLLPTVALFLAIVSFHSRTRFRIVLIPGLVLCTAITLPSALTSLGQLSSLLAAACAITLAIYLVCRPARYEH